MAQSPEERKLAAKRARAWKLYRITLEEQDKVEDYQRWNPDFAVLLTKGDPKETALLFNDHNHITGLYRGRLAYLINKLAKAHYLCVNIEADQAVMAELEHAFKFNDAVLRHLTVLKKKADTGPSSMMKTVEREETRKAQQAEYQQQA